MERLGVRSVASALRSTVTLGDRRRAGGDVGGGDCCWGGLVAVGNIAVSIYIVESQGY
jgi:hypothetical protein